MKTLGLNISGYISSAALASDGRIVAASCEERYTRIKRDRAFPSNAIAHALDAGGCSPEELDAVVIAWNPSKNLHKNLGLLQEANRARAKYLTYVPNELASWFDEESSQETEQRLFGKTARLHRSSPGSCGEYLFHLALGSCRRGECRCFRRKRYPGYRASGAPGRSRSTPASFFRTRWGLFIVISRSFWISRGCRRI